MKIILAIVLLSILSNQSRAADHGCRHEAAVEQLFIKTFGEDPSNPTGSYELDVSEQCSALKTEISARQGFKVVIPPCVALGLDQYE